MSVSRRNLLRVLPAAAVAIPLEAQQTAPATPTDDPELQGARQYLRTGARLVRQVELTPAVEPAMKFVPRG